MYEIMVKCRYDLHLQVSIRLNDLNLSISKGHLEQESG